MKYTTSLFKTATLTLVCLGLLAAVPSQACTGISFTSKDGSHILARSIEWAKERHDSRYVVVPRGHQFQSLTPQGQNGMKYEARYGFVGVRVSFDDLIVEGLNESGLSAGLFFFPESGSYEPFSADCLDHSVCDLQLVSWALARFSTVEQVLEALPQIRVIALDPRAGTLHWRLADRSGREIVLEIIDGKPQVYENTIGVLTNSPGFSWHLTNLSNYVNMTPGTGEALAFASFKDSYQVKALSGGSGMHGLPGDHSSPSRFVRIASYKATAPVPCNARRAVLQAFKILEAMVIPIGAVLDVNAEDAPCLITSTQFTTASDLEGRKFYYRTMDNSRIRCLDLNSIDFQKIKYTVRSLDESEEEIVTLSVK